MNVKRNPGRVRPIVCCWVLFGGALVTMVVAAVAACPEVMCWVSRSRLESTDWSIRIKALDVLAQYGTESSLRAVLNRMDCAMAEADQIRAGLDTKSSTAKNAPEYRRMVFLRIEGGVSRKTLDAICQRRRLACIPVLSQRLLRRDRTFRAVVQAIDRLGPTAVEQLRSSDYLACELLLDELGRIRQEEEASNRELDGMLLELDRMLSDFEMVPVEQL